MSAINEIPTPKFCVVKDNYVTLKNESVYFIFETKGGEQDIEERTMDLKMNTHDGMGLVDPVYAEKLRQYLKLDWDISTWGVRGPFIKGLVVPFDFKKFGREIAEKEIIIDLWGNEVNINEVDMILTESQFKMWRYYTSIEDFMAEYNKRELVFGICKYNKRKDEEYSLLNYQYIQTLDLTPEDIEKLIEPTIDNIKKVCEGDKLRTLLFLLGMQDDTVSLKDIVNSVNVNFVKAILYNPNVLKDSYIKTKIYNFIEKQIQVAKLGRVYVRGNYQTMMADPYALCESFFDLEVKGLLEAKEVYSKWWLDRGDNKADFCRSPMVASEEHNVMNIVDPHSIDKLPEGGYNWYQYLNSGIVYNIWDASTIIHSDSD
jgi:hypothetical protein